MTDVTSPPPGGRVEPVDIQVEMQRSYLDYAMSVIVGRALPDVRDGLKPVHRRVLYAMYDGGYRPDRGYVKCSRVVGDTMGLYHPHGDSAIYDTLVRLAQPWSMREPLVDGNGNFGSQGDDPPAAMRYCVVGDARVALADGGARRIADLVPGATPHSDTPIDVKLRGRNGEPVRATTLFHSGNHPTVRVRTREGFALTGTANHPVLCLAAPAGVPMLLWRLLSELRPGDRVVVHRGHEWPSDDPDFPALDLAHLAGAFVAEGFVSERRAGFNNVDHEYFTSVLDAFDRVVGGPRYVYSRLIASGSTLHELDIPNLERWQATPLAELGGLRSADKRVPEFVWRAGGTVQQVFLAALYEGDGSCSLLSRNSIQISYSTRSSQLAADVQQLLLRLGVISRVVRHATGELKVVIGNRRDAMLFLTRVGFAGRKQDKLAALLDRVPAASTALASDHVPYVADYIRSDAGGCWADRDWLARHNIDRIERWERDGDEILRRIANPEVRRVVEPLADGSYYYAEVAFVEDAGIQPVYSVRVDSADHAFLTDGFVSHNTEARLAPLAMEMLRDIDQETVDFTPNYDGSTQEPLVLPSRIPNLLVNGGAGIAVGMATSIPTHNLREVAAGVQWFLDSPDADDAELLAALTERIPGPDFPTGALIVGRDGIEDAYRTGRGSIRMRAVVEVEEDSRGRQQLVVTELPYQVNKDSLLRKIGELVDDGRVQGIADLADMSARGNLRLVVTLKRDGVPRVVLNNLYKHTQLQDTFGVNMVALVDGVPRTLNLAQVIRYYVGHQIEIIVRRSRYRLRRAEERAHILRGLLKAIDRIDEVIALIRGSESAEAARAGLRELLEIDDVQATAILDMQLRRLAALERQRLQDEYDELTREIANLQAILDSPARQREIIGTELGEIVERHASPRATRIVPYDGDLSLEDLIPDEDVVVTISRTGYAKRTKTALYRSQRRGGKGVAGATLREDDIVDHFFVTSTHHWILFFTNKGRVYRAKAHEIPEFQRAARGQHVANILAFQPDERIAQVIDIKDYGVAPYLVLATKTGLVKKTPLRDFDSPRSGGIVAINLRDDDELIAAALVSGDDHLLLVSRQAQSIRFSADDDTLRPMGRATSGVIGMRFGDGDELLAMEVVREDADVLIATDGGYAKRTRMSEYPVQGRGGKGVLTAKIVAKRGQLVGALIARPEEEIFAITSGGGVIRTTVREVRRAQRQTQGVRLINLAPGDAVVAIARNAEPDSETDEP